MGVELYIPCSARNWARICKARWRAASFCWERGRWPRGRRGGLGGFGRVELNPADIEILFEAVQLQEVGELEGADISASFADLPLEIADDPLEIGLVEAGLEELIPEPFPIKAQAHALAGQPAVQRVSLLNALDHELWRVKAGQPGHLFHGLLQGLGADFPGFGPSGFQPGGPRQQADAARHAGRGPHQQIHRGRLEDLGAINAHGFQPGFEIGSGSPPASRD